jgi:hypothetical protein
MGIDREEVRHRLTAGESLEISTGGGSYEVWVEPYANPAAVFEALEQDQVTCRWVEPQGIQTKTCQEAHRQRAASNSALSV